MKLCLKLAMIAALVCGQAWAAPPVRHQYILRLKSTAAGTASLKGIVEHGGGHVDFDLKGWLVVTIPDTAYYAIRAHAAVKYMQLVVSGPFVQAATTEALHIAATATTATNSAPPGTSLRYTYDGAGNISAVGSDTFVYDGLSRLVTATVEGRTETYNYDAFGNLIYKTTHDPTTTPATTLPVDLTPDTATNHLRGQAYDAAGDLTGDSSETNAFDPVTMQREKDIPGSQLSELYVYDASDERVGVLECGGPPATCTDATMIWSIRDESGNVLRQYEGTYLPGTPSNAPPWAWVEDYVYRDGLLLGAERVAEEGGRRHFHLDHLGTPRLVTNATGGELATHDYYPFGVEIPPSFQDTASGYDREEPMRFTGQERDFNVGTTSENANYNDFMHARPTIPQWGRFLSVDPLEGNPSLPQTWNRYSYVINSPVNFIDPFGLSWWDPYDPKGIFNGSISVCGNPMGCGTYFFGWFGGNDANALNRFSTTFREAARSIKNEICSALPTGRTVGVSGAVGALGSFGGGAELLVNYNSGQTSAFGFGSFQPGWNGAASYSVYTGFVWGLSPSNSNYSNGFTGFNASMGAGIVLASSSGGLASLSSGPGGVIPNGNVRVVGPSWGQSLTGPTLGFPVSNYSNAVPLGKYWPLALNPLDDALYNARQLCK